MKCNQLICAQSVITDKTSNQISIINIYETALVALFPTQIPVLTLYISFEREDGDELDVSVLLLITLNETEILRQPMSITFIDGDPRNNTTVNMQGLIIGGPGELKFSILANDNELETYSFAIKLRN